VNGGEQKDVGGKGGKEEVESKARIKARISTPPHVERLWPVGVHQGSDVGVGNPHGLRALLTRLGTSVGDPHRDLQRLRHTESPPGRVEKRSCGGHTQARLTRLHAGQSAQTHLAA
jgi:hypothetical protein